MLLTSKQTDKQTNASKNINSLVEVTDVTHKDIACFLIKIWLRFPKIPNRLSKISQDPKQIT